MLLPNLVVVFLYLLSCAFRSYSYYIEVSMDESDWVRVVDYSNYHCRSWQRLYFPQRVVRFIRIVGRNLQHNNSLYFFIPFYFF